MSWDCYPKPKGQGSFVSFRWFIREGSQIKSGEQLTSPFELMWLAHGLGILYTERQGKNTGLVKCQDGAGIENDLTSVKQAAKIGRGVDWKRDKMRDDDHYRQEWSAIKFYPKQTYKIQVAITNVSKQFHCKNHGQFDGSPLIKRFANEPESTPPTGATGVIDGDSLQLFWRSQTFYLR